MSTREVAALLAQATTHLRASRLAQAEALCRQALQLDPAEPEALGLLGQIAGQAGKPAIAVQLLDQALARRPGSAELLGHRALALKALGRLPEAIESYRQALKARPGDFTLLYNLGNAQREAGQLDDAAATLRRAVKRQPASVEAQNNLGLVLRQLGRNGEAIGYFGQAIALNPRAAPLHFNLGTALAADGQTEAASQSFFTAAQLAPDTPEPWHMLGQILARTNRVPQALDAFGRALKVAESAALHTDVASALAQLNQRDAALPHLRRAAQLVPDDPQAHTNLGMLLRDVGDDAGAVAALEHALKVRPDYPPARYHLGLTHLLAERLAQGWPLYEARMEAMTGARARFAAPVWRGEAMRGETLLLHAEQGLGDTLEFCRFVPMVAAASGARVVLEVQAPLKRLLAGLPGVDALLAYGETLPAFDRHCPLPSLPIAFGTTLATLPASVPYLAADPARVDVWRERLAALPGRKVGLVWAGNAEYEHDSLRSIPPEGLVLLEGIAGVTFVSLQKERGRGADGTAPAPVTVDWTDELTDVAETAALMQALDLVISADTAMVHLAGALGRPVWLLNRFDTDWRWFRDRTEDSPWYPTLRQFRQTVRADWTGVLEAARMALEADHGAAG